MTVKAGTMQVITGTNVFHGRSTIINVANRCKQIKSMTHHSKMVNVSKLLWYKSYKIPWFGNPVKDYFPTTEHHIMFYSLI